MTATKEEVALAKLYYVNRNIYISPEINGSSN